MRGARLGVVALGLLAVPLLSSCTGGMLDPQSPRADKVIVLWWVMLGTSSVIFVFLCGLLLWGLRRASRNSARAREGQLDRDRYLVLGGGIALPVTVMVVLMVLTVWAGRSITEAADSDAVTVEVIGHQWWWEVRYPDTGLVTANEIHIPSGEPVNILLKSEDVIHSFWVPELSGKIDLIPGRTNSLIIEASHPGEFRGQCAEFCGLQHAGMRILVVAEDRDSFDQWVQEQGEPAPALNPADDAQLWEGQQAFLGSACVYCHTIRGTNGSGTLGPDLTHIASRQRLASNMIPNTRGHLAGWILDPQAVKPGTQMPPTQLSADQLDALLDYLESLEMTASTHGQPVSERLSSLWERPRVIDHIFATVDHKRLGVRYMVTAFVFFLVGGTLAGMMRTQLAVPENQFLGPESYNRIFTMHGTTMIFYFATPMLTGIATYILPLMLGTRDLAFPRLNAFAYWVFLFSGLFIYTSFLVDEVPDGGWFAYVPLTGPNYSQGLGMDFWTLAILFLGISTTAAAINFVVTILRMRAPGMAVQRMPLFLWGVLDMAFTILIALPSLTLATLLLALDRTFGTHFYDPAGGGNPLLWQHLFWIWGHPEVYILLLPSLGIISTVVTAHARREVVMYPLVAVASVAIGILAFGLWVHHMFSTGLDLLPISFFSAASFTIAIPSGISIFAWVTTIYGGRVRFSPAFMFALGFIVTFVIGGVSGVMVAMVPFDWQVHDSYFVVAHFHYVLVGGVVFPVFAGLYHWFPKITGRMTVPTLGHGAFWLIFLGFNITFFPQHILGLLGMPRRVYTYAEGLGWDTYNAISTAGYVVLGLGIIVMVFDFLWSMQRGEEAGDDPWEADSLEWATPSPPEPYNFAHLPIVHSRTPMWLDRTPERGGQLDRIEDPMDDGREVVTTSVLDAAPDAVLRVPEPSYVPLFAALALTVAVVAMLVEVYPVSVAGIVGLGALLAVWLWRSPAPAPERVNQIRDRVHLPDVRIAGPHSLGRWGMIFFIVTEAVLFGSLISSYFLVRGSADEWPLGGIAEPELILPAILTALIVLSSASMFWAQRQVEGSADRNPPLGMLRLALVVSLALGIAFLSLQAYEFHRSEFGPSTNAYGSLFFMITGTHAAHMGVGVLLIGWTLLRTWFVSHEPGQRSDVPNVALYWHFVGVVWLVILSVVYLGVRGL